MIEETKKMQNMSCPEIFPAEARECFIFNRTNLDVPLFLLPAVEQTHIIRNGVRYMSLYVGRRTTEINFQELYVKKTKI